jgi:hypothetical protein
MVFGTIFLVKEKYQKLEASAASGEQPDQQPTASLSGYHRAICPRRLLDRVVEFQCSYLCYRKSRVTKHLITFL